MPGHRRFAAALIASDLEGGEMRTTMAILALVLTGCQPTWVEWDAQRNMHRRYQADLRECQRQYRGPIGNWRDPDSQRIARESCMGGRGWRITSEAGFGRPIRARRTLEAWRPPLVAGPARQDGLAVNGAVAAAAGSASHDEERLCYGARGIHRCVYGSTYGPPP